MGRGDADDDSWRPGADALAAFLLRARSAAAALSCVEPAFSRVRLQLTLPTRDIFIRTAVRTRDFPGIDVAAALARIEASWAARSGANVGFGHAFAETARLDLLADGPAADAAAGILEAAWSAMASDAQKRGRIWDEVEKRTRVSGAFYDASDGEPRLLAEPARTAASRHEALEHVSSMKDGPLRSLATKFLAGRP